MSSVASEQTTATPTAAAKDFVRRFEQLRRADVSFAGGKGANLGELTAAGLPVPPGFVIGAPAYAAFCDEVGLRRRIAEILTPVDVEDVEALEAATKRIRRDSSMTWCVTRSRRSLSWPASRNPMDGPVSHHASCVGSRSSTPASACGWAAKTASGSYSPSA